MKEFGNEKRRQHGFGRIGLTMGLPFILIAVTYVVYKLFFIPAPVVRGMEAFNILPADKNIILDGENLKSIDIFVYQDGKKVELLKDSPGGGQKTYTLQINPKELGLSDGKALVIITAKAGIMKEVTYEINSVIDTVPPSLLVLKAPSIIHRGSGGFALLRASGADSVFVNLALPAPHGQMRENLTFSAFPVTSERDLQPRDSGIRTEIRENKKRKQTKTYYVFFPAPFNVEEGSVFYAVARDIAGNQSVRALSTQLKTKTYRKSSISIDDSFIRQVVSPLLNSTHIDDPEDAFKQINEEWREDSVKSIIDISRITSPEMLWKGRFLQLKNSKVMATYGDERTYFYKGKKISESVHLGYDLASFANAPVEAANSGIVRFAGDLSIYGNTVIIDHGLGLMSLYGHLSTVVVQEGQAIQKGEVIGNTGSTGLAGGDHLHFGVLIHGYEVSPLYWWDPMWIEVNVINYIDIL